MSISLPSCYSMASRTLTTSRWWFRTTPICTSLRGECVVWAAVDEETRRLDGSGRILVRTSGAEELVRVMAEAATHDDVEGACARIVAVVEEHLT